MCSTLAERWQLEAWTAVVDVDGRKPLKRWFLVALLLGAFGLRVYGLTLQDIWWDEARNIDVSLRPLLQVSTAPELDIHPPVYFWLLHVWSRLAGASPILEPAAVAFLMRFVSVFAGVVSVALLYAFTRKIESVSTALLAATIGAFSPFWLAESQEARMYTVGIALLTAAAFWFLRGLPTGNAGSVASRENRRRWPYLLAFAVLSSLAFATHYNSVFILVAWYLWWGVYALTRGKDRRLREMGVAVLTGFLSLVLVLPVGPIAIRQIPGYENPNLTVPSIAQYLWQNWQAYIGGYSLSPDLLWGKADVWLWTVLAVMLIGLALHLFVNHSAEERGNTTGFSFAVFWCAGGLALYYIAVVDRGAFNVRYSSFVTPALYSLLAIGIAGWAMIPRYLPIVGALILLAGFLPAVDADLHDRQYAREDIAGLTDWLRENAGQEDLVLVDQKYPFGFYYDRYSIDADDTPSGAEAADARYMFVDINTIGAVLNQWASEVERVYWVRWYESDTDPRRAVSFLLDKEGVRQGEASFRGYSVDWWQLDPPNEFVLAPGMDPAQIQFDHAVRTIEASLPENDILQGGQAPVVIRWELVTGGAIHRPLKARIGIYGEDGGRIAQIDKRLLNDRHLLPEEWEMTDQPLNVYMLDVPDDASPGGYDLRLLVYDAETLEPLSFVDEAGNPAGIEPTIGTLKIVRNE